MIKVISFDIGGTLLINEKNDKYNLKSLASLVDLPYENVREVYKRVFQKSKGSFDELVNVFCNNLEIKVNDEINNFFYNKFNCNTGSISQKKIDIIKKLKSMGYKIILFSNNCCLIKNNFDSDFFGLVDEFFYSFDLGYTKSDEESYSYIEKKMNVLPEEFLHIGDTLKSDYVNPIKNGWNALYFGEIDDNNIYNITSLDEIFDYLRIKGKSL